jgi:hypothetical protein
MQVQGFRDDVDAALAADDDAATERAAADTRESQGAQDMMRTALTSYMATWQGTTSPCAATCVP